MRDLLPQEDPGPEWAEVEEEAEEGSGIPPLISRLMSAREFCAIERPPPEPLLGPLIYRGRRLVVAGETGAGKSTWSYQATHAICHAEDFLGYRGAGGRGLILDFEQDEEDVADLLRASGMADSDLIDVISVPHGVAFDKEPRYRKELEDVYEAGKYCVVLLDPLYKVFGGDSSNERESVELMRHFDFWRSGANGRWPKHGLIVPMHARKPPPKAKFTIAEIFGSTAWVRGAENVYGIQFVNQGYSQLYAWKMRSHRIQDAEPADDDVTLNRGDIMGMVFKLGEGFRRGKAQPKEKAIDTVARVLQEFPEEVWTTEKLMEAVPGRGGEGHASRSTIDRCLRELGDAVRAGTAADGAKTFSWVGIKTRPTDEDIERWEEAARG